MLTDWTSLQSYPFLPFSRCLLMTAFYNAVIPWPNSFAVLPIS